MKFLLQRIEFFIGLKNKMEKSPTLYTNQKQAKSSSILYINVLQK